MRVGAAATILLWVAKQPTTRLIGAQAAVAAAVHKINEFPDWGWQRWLWTASSSPKRRRLQPYQGFRRLVYRTEKFISRFLFLYKTIDIIY